MKSLANEKISKTLIKKYESGEIKPWNKGKRRKVDSEETRLKRTLGIVVGKAKSRGYLVHSKMRQTRFIFRDKD